jgi:hypothetical protein
VDEPKKEKPLLLRGLAKRFKIVEEFREKSKAKETRPAAKYPHRFRQIQGRPGSESIIVPIHSSESREYLPVGYLKNGSIISNAAYGLYGSNIFICLLLHRASIWFGFLQSVES